MALENFREYEGDLLQAEVDVIAHQTNCTSLNVSGLAAAIFQKHPKANGNLQNPDFSRYGTTELREAQGAPYKFVANIYGQVYPGHPKPQGPDTKVMRQVAFGQCVDLLAEIMKDADLTSVAFPAYVGCGLAGGEWADYRDTIMVLAEDNPTFEVHIIEKK
jgi:O-acetyl-ADP-ribose deacetylase (regulator of RNase III)